MNRTLKCRGMTLGGEWITGTLTTLTKHFNGIDAGNYISNSRGAPFAFEVRPETIGQFTTILDEHQTEIYEDDILEYRSLQYGEHKPYLISWCTESVGFECTNADNFMLPCVWDEMVIVGNLHNNPHLMESV